MGHDVTILSSHFQGMARQARINGYNVIRVGNHEIFPFAAWAMTRQLLTSFDIVIEDLNKVPLLLPLVVRGRRRMYVVVHHLNRKIFIQELSFWKAAIAYVLESIMPFLYSRLLKVPLVAVSENTKQELLELGAVKRDVSVIYNGTTNRNSSRLRGKSWKQKTRNPTIVYLGRLKKYKRPDHALLAFRLIVRELPKAKLTIIGEGEMLGHLIYMAHSLKIPNVQFVGRVDERKKNRILAKSWILLQTSEKEGWGLAVMEAGVWGTPSAVYDVPGLRECVRHNMTGVVVQPNINDMAAAVVNLLRSKNALEAMSRSVMNHAEAFTWDRTASEIDLLMREGAHR